MSPCAPKSIDAEQRQQALAGWENEGGAGPCGPLETLRSLGAGLQMPKMGKADLPIPTVVAIANTPQNVTRRIDLIIGAPRTRAPRTPSRRKQATETRATIGTSKW